MPQTELIDQLLGEAEDDRRRIERRESVLRALRDAVSGATRAPLNANGESGTAAIVAARVAYGFYLRNGAYVCQPFRAFNRDDLTHIGFYADGAIQAEIPEIVERRQNVEWTFANAAQLRETGDVLDLRLAELIEQSLRTRDQGLQEGEHHDVFLLTRAEEPETFVLPQRIVHHTWKHSGSPYTRKHRYVYLEALETSPADTDELDAAQHEIDVRRRLGTP
jgi:hypothetical protein